MVHVHVFVSGRVQGVFYRARTKEQAERLGLTGWVQNLSDGRVEALFEGEKERVEEMIEWCREGPRGARVEGVEVGEIREIGEIGEDKGFKIRR